MHVNLRFVVLLGWVAVLSGCGKKEPALDATAARGIESSGKQAEPNAANMLVKQELSAVEKSVKNGAHDEAAASLVKLRMRQTQFTQQEAAAYRETVSEAYSRALEAAAKGDARAKAAVQMIRAAGPHH